MKIVWSSKNLSSFDRNEPRLFCWNFLQNNFLFLKCIQFKTIALFYGATIYLKYFVGGLSAVRIFVYFVVVVSAIFLFSLDFHVE